MAPRKPRAAVVQPETTLPTRKRALEAPSKPESKRVRRDNSIEDETFNDSGNEYDAETQPDSEQNAPPAPISILPESDDRFTLRRNIYACTFVGCNRTFDRPCRLSEHERMHTGDRPFHCEYPGCGKTFQRDYHLSRHKKNHEGVRDYKCSYEGCDKAYGTNQKLKQHLESHEKKKAFTCTGFEGCNEVFRKKNTLQAHIASVHLKQKPYQCTYIDGLTRETCTKGYDTEGKLNSHISKVHLSGERFVCTVCSSGTATDSGISISQDDTSGAATPASTTISMPSYAFPSYNLLQSHLAKAHPPTCPHCHAACTSKRDLNNHIEVAHPESSFLPPKPPAQTFPCSFEDCDRVFTKRGNLAVHVSTVHENVKKFICGQVDHTGSKKLKFDNGETIPFDNADGCATPFGTKAQLENHIRTQHLGLENWDTVCKRKKGTLPATPQERKHRGGGGNQKAKPFPAASLLTGHGYEESGRDIKCLVPGCENLFFREDDLRRHCASKLHNMAEVEIEEILREREALAGGVFWYGGIDPAEERGFAEYEEDDDEFDRRYLGRRGEDVVIDPALESMNRVKDFVCGVEGADGDVEYPCLRREGTAKGYV